MAAPIYHLYFLKKSAMETQPDGLPGIPLSHSSARLGGSTTMEITIGFFNVTAICMYLQSAEGILDPRSYVLWKSHIPCTAHISN